MPRAVPAVPTTYYPKEPIAAADWNAFVYAVGFHIHPPTALLFQNVTQVITSSTNGMRITYDSAERDSDAGHDPTANSSRFTAPIPGLYHVTAIGSIAANNPNGVERSVCIMVNNTTIWAIHLLAPYTGAQGSIFYGSCSLDIPMNAGDYVEAQLWQDSGDNTVRTSTGAAACRLLVHWAGT